MASIQQSLNNLFAASLGVGFAAVHTPSLRQHVEKRTELAKLQKQQQALEAAELQGEIPKDIEQEAANRIYKENRERDISNIINRQQIAQESKRGVQNAVKQRRSFLEAMKNERVSFGGKAGGYQTFGQLPSQLQKQIASHYSKSERKKVMDRHYGKK